MSVKGLGRRDIALQVIALDSIFPDMNPADRSDLQWLIDENNEWQPDFSREGQVQEKRFIDSTELFYTLGEKVTTGLDYSISRRPFLKRFYRTPAHFFEVNSGDFKLRVNPLLNFRIAKDKNDDQVIFENQRGISIRGAIDNKVYFHTDILESQARYPGYVRDYQEKFSAVPGAGFIKPYQSSIFNFDKGVDFLLANAYVGTSVSKHVQIELGHGRHFIGNGIRSLFLSDFATDYFYLKLNTRVWKFHYQNIFGELLQGRNRGVGDMLIPKKYFAAHYLSLNITKNLYLGLFETVVFARENQFELQYLNPIILYRTVEGSIGSPDNVLLGLDLKYNIWNKVSLYGQLVLDEFKIGEIRDGNGWWANKYGMQAGLKWMDVFNVSHLDAQVEYNSARPYIYSHNTGIAYYGHYRQSLAHPLGGNFRESIFRLNYQLNDRWFMTARMLSMKTGEDIDSLNYGSNILIPNGERVQDYGNEIGQGIATNIMTLGLDISYQLKHGLFLDAFFQSRKKDSALNERDDSSVFVGGGIRMNLGRRWQEF